MRRAPCAPAARRPGRRSSPAYRTPPRAPRARGAVHARRAPQDVARGRGRAARRGPRPARRGRRAGRRRPHARRRACAGDLEQIPDGHETLLRAVVQIAADTPAPRIGGFDDTGARAPQGGRLLTTLELGRRSRGEDTHRGDVIVPCPHRPRVHHADVAEMGAIGRAQADRQIALEAHLDRRLGLREAPRQRLRERDDRIAPRPARTACRACRTRTARPSSRRRTSR